jgi:hypothetical protein
VKLRIDGTDYDYHRAMEKIGLKHLYDLKVQADIGKRTVSQALDLLVEGLKAEENDTPEQAAERAEAVQEDARVLLGLAGLVFICKRFAGEIVSFDDAGQFGLGDLVFVAEDSDVAEPDPTQALAAEAEQGSSDEPSKNEPVQSLKKSKTSKPRSTAA